MTLTVTSKGQVTLKRGVLDHLGVARGDRLEVDLLPGGRVEVRAAARPPISSMYGMFANPDGPKFTIEEINEAIADGWAGLVD